MKLILAAFCLCGALFADQTSTTTAKAPAAKAPEAQEPPVDEPFLYELRTELGAQYAAWFLGAPCKDKDRTVCYAVFKGGPGSKELGRIVLKKSLSRKALRAEFEKKLKKLTGK
jgi:hypothetical protein